MVTQKDQHIGTKHDVDALLQSQLPVARTKGAEIDCVYLVRGVRGFAAPMVVLLSSAV